jgi:hypothetical protein
MDIKITNCDEDDIWLNEYRMSLYSYRNTNNWLRLHGKKMRRGRAKYPFKRRRKMDNTNLAHLLRKRHERVTLPGDFDGDPIIISD